MSLRRGNANIWKENLSAPSLARLAPNIQLMFTDPLVHKVKKAQKSEGIFGMVSFSRTPSVALRRNSANRGKLRLLAGFCLCAKCFLFRSMPCFPIFE